MSNKTFDLNKAFDDFLGRKDTKSVCLQLLLAAFCIVGFIGGFYILDWLILINNS